jgi:hypothetical protein
MKKADATGTGLFNATLRNLTRTQHLLNFSNHAADAAAGQADGAGGTGR